MRNFITCTHPQISLGKSSQVKADEVGGACGTHGRGDKIIQVLVGRPEVKRPFGRPRRRWEV
jgi:hypothetical protein